MINFGFVAHFGFPWSVHIGGTCALVALAAAVRTLRGASGDWRSAVAADMSVGAVGENGGG